ncbi:hypothetical protein [Trinickia acidisoli]|uniref:hypothetical protein n=1 Tax=Trinickia acidisoli TaxID=2767482 RepID=UPI001A8F14AB|nr:hypothetical protein [Trinickia acidisoli]
MTSALIVTSLSGLPAYAQTNGIRSAAGVGEQAVPPAETCADRAARARTVAEDRDSGVTRQQELSKLKAQWSRSPLEREDETPAMLALLVNGIYDAYGEIPARTIYDRYLQYCTARRHSDDVGQ